LKRLHSLEVQTRKKFVGDGFDVVEESKTVLINFKCESAGFHVSRPLRAVMLKEWMVKGWIVQKSPAVTSPQPVSFTSQ